MTSVLVGVATLGALTTRTGLAPTINRPSARMWIDDRQLLFFSRLRAPPRTAPFCPPSDGWCPEMPHNNRVGEVLIKWWTRGRQLQQKIISTIIARLDPSSRFPKPQPAPLSLLAQSVGKETLVENKGRKAKIRRRRRVVRKSHIENNGWAAMEDGCF